MHQTSKPWFETVAYIKVFGVTLTVITGYEESQMNSIVTVTTTFVTYHPKNCKPLPYFMVDYGEEKIEMMRRKKLGKLL